MILLDAAGKSLTVPERTTLRMTATVRDETGAVIPAAGLATLTLTLYARDEAGAPVVNGVDHADILNAGRGVVHATSGLLTLTLTPADNQIVAAANALEWHRALMEWTYDAGAKAGKTEVDFQVRNLTRVS